MTMIKTTINHNDVVVSTILSSRWSDWGHLREVEEVREDIYIDPSHIADSLGELEKRLSPKTLRTLTDVGENILRQYKKGDPHTTFSIDLMRRVLPELPYFEREPVASECRTLEYMVFNAFPWMLYLIITDPAL